MSSFKYLGVNISEDLTWTKHIQTQVKKARQRLYYLRQLRKFRVSAEILKTFYSGAIESVLTQCISMWYGNSSNQDCKALQRVVHLAERISGSALLFLQDIYLKRCKSRAIKIIKDSNHPGNVFSFYCHLASASGAWLQNSLVLHIIALDISLLVISCIIVHVMNKSWIYCIAFLIIIINNNNEPNLAFIWNKKSKNLL